MHRSQTVLRAPQTVSHWHSSTYPSALFTISAKNKENAGEISSTALAPFIGKRREKELLALCTTDLKSPCYARKLPRKDQREEKRKLSLLNKLLVIDCLHLPSVLPLDLTVFCHLSSCDRQIEESVAKLPSAQGRRHTVKNVQELVASPLEFKRNEFSEKCGGIALEGLKR